MNAEQAREMTRESLKLPNISPLLQVVFRKIRQAAEDGKYSITDPFHGLRMPFPDSVQRDAVWRFLGGIGYKVIHHPDPDPGHPASRPYTEISWD